MLSDAITSALPEMRAHAESLMLDYGTALRPTGGFEVVDGVEVQAADTLFASPCKIQARNLQAQEEQVGGRTATTIRLELHLPATTAPLNVGDLWETTTVHPLSTARQSRYRITAPVGKTLATANRYTIEEVTS